MKNISVEYMGLKLKSPVIVSSSPLTSSVEKIVELERRGVGAVVLKSIFEEQIIGESALMERYDDYPEAADYLKGYMQEGYLQGFLKMIEQAKATVSIPIIASINCTMGGEWVEYAKRIESAGADALEVNIFVLPVSADQSAQSIEESYMKIIDRVTSGVKIPISVKLSSHFTNILSVAAGAYNRGVRAVVMYNRLFEPDIDIENMRLTSFESTSSSAELRNSLRAVAMCSSQLPALDVSISTGVHTGKDAVKSLLVGARAVQVCSAIYINGLGVIEEINNFIGEWAERHGYNSIEEFCGAMSYKQSENSEFYQRVQYMKYIPSGK